MDVRVTVGAFVRATGALGGSPSSPGSSCWVQPVSRSGRRRPPMQRWGPVAPGVVLAARRCPAW
eukprot:2652048-Lingulodinium_polyedra.AAC.1